MFGDTSLYFCKTILQAFDKNKAMKKYICSGLIVLSLFFFSCSEIENNRIPSSDFSGQLSNEEIEKGRLTPEILWKMGRISDPHLSPDGSTLVFNLTKYEYKTNAGVTSVCTIPVNGGEMSNLTGFLFNALNPRWKSDGSGIFFLSDESGDYQIWEMNPGKEVRKQLTHIQGGISGFEFSPDGEHVMYLKDVKLDMTANELHPDLPLANVRIIDDLMYRHWDRWHDYAYSHIFISEYKEGEISPGKDIMEGEPWDAPLSPYFDLSEISWKTDGRMIAYTCKKMKGKDYALSTNSDIYLYDLYEGTTENLTKGMQGYDKCPVFSNDGGKIAWQSMETPGYEADKNRLFVMDLESGDKYYLTRDFDQDVEKLVWSKDDSHIFFISGTQATYQIYSIDVNDLSIVQITEGDHDYTDFNLGDGFITGEKMSISMAPELFRVDIENGEESAITSVNKYIYDKIKMGKVEERWVTTTDGKSMKVWVIYPPDFDPEKQYPALLYCQGGPQSAVSQFFSFRWNFQIMAANDYIVVAPNRRGLPTFGSEWNEQISGDYGGQNIRDYLSAIDDLKKEPYIDEDRLGAVGASYGGYSVFYLAGHHNGRFKAFISHCGIFNFESMYGSTEEVFFTHHDLGGAYWDSPRPPSYRFSPHLYADKWDTPIMIITGEKDFRIPYTESLQAFDAAQLRGIPSKLLVFPDESHWVRKPQNSILWQREFFSWLDEYLK